MWSTKDFRLLEGILVLVLVAVAVVGVALPLAGPAGLGLRDTPALSVAVDVGADSEQAEVGGSVVLGEPRTATATVREPTAAQRVGLLGAELLEALTALVVAGLLLRVVRTLRVGDVFVAANARRLQLIALVVAVGGTAAQLLHGLGRAAVLDALSSRDPGVILSFELSFLPLLVAGGVLVLAEVFRQGAALREDVEGLV